MSLRETTSAKQRSASLTGSKLSRDSVINCLHKSGSQHSPVTHESRFPVRRLYKDVLIQRSNSTTNTSGKLSQKAKIQRNIDQCLCLDCSGQENIPKSCLQELDNMLATLSIELCKEKNENQLLRRNVLIVKKVVQTEIGGNSVSFESLLQRAIDDDWMGRQRMIFILKRKLRNLNKMVKELEDKNQNVSLKDEFLSGRKESPIRVIPDERQLFWCLELERQDVFRGADREKQRLISDRDLLRNKLDPLTKKNKELVDELKNLREKIEVTQENVGKGISERLRLIEKQLKTLLYEKVQTRQMLDGIQQQICRKTKAIYELRAKITLERQIAKDQETLLKSLKTDETHLSSLQEEVRKESDKGVITAKKKLSDMERDYNEIKKIVEDTLSSMSDRKHTLEILKWHHTDHRFLSLMRSSESNSTLSDEGKNGFVMKLQDLANTGNESESSAEITPKLLIQWYETKLQKQKSILVDLESKNIEKSEKINSIIFKINEVISKYLRDCTALRKLGCEIGGLKNRISRYQKASRSTPKQKLVKTKHSSLPFAGTLEWKRQYLSILETENKFIKTLIQRIYKNEHDDFDLFEAFLCTTKCRF